MKCCLNAALLACLSMTGLRAQEPPLRSGIPAPLDLDLRTAQAEALLPGDARDNAWNEAALRAWEPYLNRVQGAASVRILLPSRGNRIPLLLAASQALKARFPSMKLYLGFQPDQAPILDETAWGAVEGGALLPSDLGETQARWRERLVQAQTQFPGRPWTLWLPMDPGPLVAQLMGDGGKLVVPEGGPGARLAALIPTGYTDVEGGLGDLTLRPRSVQNKALRWGFQNGQWVSIALPSSRTEVLVQDREAYDVGALLARMRAERVRQQLAVRNLQATTDVNLHFQAEGGGGDLGFRFQLFEHAGEPELLLRKQVLFNGVKANLSGNTQLPIVESSTAMAAPAALTLTERYRYEDGGSAGPGKRILRFHPVDKDPLLFEGELTVEEATGRIVEERSQRSNLPGVVRSEQRTLSYGEAAPGIWRALKIHTSERWIGASGIDQVLRDITYRDFSINAPAFEATRQAALQGNDSLLQNTGEGLRYLVKQSDGTRKIEPRMKSGASGVGGMLLVVPGAELPVIPLAGYFLFDFNALDKGIQYSLITAGVFNDLNLVVPKAVLGWDFTSHLTLSLLGGDERPVKDGKEEDKDAVQRRTQVVDLALGRDLGAGFRAELKGHFTHDAFSDPQEDKYKTEGFVNPPSGWTRLGGLQLSWQYKGFQLRGEYSEGLRPKGVWGAPGELQTVPEDGRITRWDSTLLFDTKLGSSTWFNATLGQAGGRNFDRFQPVSFDGRVSGIKPYAVVADRITYGGINVAFPTGPNLRLTLGLDHGEAHSLTDQKTYGFTGMKIAGDLPGFWWFTTFRVDLGVGLQGDVKGVRTVNGMISFIHLF